MVGGYHNMRNYIKGLIRKVENHCFKANPTAQGQRLGVVGF